MASYYQINKGVNKPIEFKGLKAQYITYLGAGLVIVFLLFVLMYLAGVNLFVCLTTIFILGTSLFFFVFSISNKYGQYGLMKKMAKRYIPHFITFRSRRVFYRLNETIIDKNERGRYGE